MQMFEKKRKKGMHFQCELKWKCTGIIDLAVPWHVIVKIQHDGKKKARQYIILGSTDVPVQVLSFWAIF